MEVAPLAAVLVILADLFGIVRTLRSTAERARKAIWVAVIVLLPVIGVVAWTLFGPT